MKRTTNQRASPCVGRPSVCLSVVCVRSPEAHDGTLLADVALGLVLGRLGGGHAVQHGQPHHGLGLHAHPVHKLPGLQLHLVTHLQGTKTQGALGPQGFRFQGGFVVGVPGSSS